MKSSYLELTLHEFLDTITNKRIVYKYEMKPSMNEGDESDTFIGHKDDLINGFKKMTANLRAVENPDTNTIETLKSFDNIISDLSASDDYYFDELTDIEVYNYLDTITKGFDPERVKLILWDIDVYYNMEYLERIDEESMNKFLKNGWEIPYVDKRILQLENGKTFETGGYPDYEKMREKTHIADGWSIMRAISILKKKLKEEENTKLTEGVKSQYVTGSVFEEIDKYFIAMILQYNEKVYRIGRGEHYNDIVTEWGTTRRALDTADLIKLIALKCKTSDDRRCVVKYIEMKYEELKGSIDLRWKETKGRKKDVMPIDRSEHFLLVSYQLHIKKDCTLTDVHNAVLQELESEYNKIIAVFDNAPRSKNTEQTKDDTDNPSKCEQPINESEIRKLFCAKLNKPQLNAANTYGDQLIASLKNPRIKKNRKGNPKEYARIASIMFHSSHINTDSCFRDWLQKFYGLVGVENGHLYKEVELGGQSLRDLKREFFYLTT